MSKTLIAAALLAFLGGQVQAQSVTNSNYVAYPDPSLISRDLSDLSRVLRRNYSKYIAYMAPNGGTIPLVATDDVTDEQLLRAYNILDFFLTDVPGTRFGADKSVIANQMADSGATLVMPGGRDGDSPIRKRALQGQPLYALEFPVEGSVPYLTNDYDQRDAGFEEIFHIVHDHGIGTKFNTGALSDSFQVEFAAATQAALDSGLWGALEEAQGWIKELTEEGSLQQEYAAAIIDSYYGYWGGWSEAPGGMWGNYVPKTRSEVVAADPTGITLIREFLPENITYMARIDPSFEGTFEMQFDESQPYTHKSQYILNARLLGTLPSGLNGNDQDNILMGNEGDNVIDAREGTDVVQFSVSSQDVDLSRDQEGVRVSNAEIGSDLLRNVEILRFTDTDIAVKDIQ